MEFFKEIYDAWGARVKSRVFGSIIVAFTLINWKVLFFLAFDDSKTTDKFAYFDEHTNVFTLYIWPIFLGGFIGLVLPFVNNWTHWFVSKPVSDMRSRDDEYAHERLKKKNEWLVERNRAQELLERQIIDEAKRDEEVAEIADPVRRAEAEEEINKSRIGAKIVFPDKKLYTFEKTVQGRAAEGRDTPLDEVSISKHSYWFLQQISKRSAGTFMFDTSNGAYRIKFGDQSIILPGRKEYLELLEADAELRKLGLLEQKGNAISKRGYDYLTLHEDKDDQRS